MKKILLALSIMLIAAAGVSVAGNAFPERPLGEPSPHQIAPLETIPHTPAASDSCETHQTASKCVANNAPDGRKCCWKGSEDHPRGGECSPCGTK